MTTTISRTGASAYGMRAFCVSVLCVLAGSANAAGVGPTIGGAVPQPLPLLPSYNWWNTNISKVPVDPKSASFIAFINNGGSRELHPDFGGDVSKNSVDIYGYPYVVVDSTQPVVAVNFEYSSESDGVNHTTNTSYPFYPIPTQSITEPHWIECGDPGSVDLRDSCDRHMLIIDRDQNFLYELYNVYYDGTHWQAGSGAFFDMTKSSRRPAGWTSADAAGLAMFPGLVRYDEVYNAYGTDVATINHAFRVTLRTTNGQVWPASHTAGSTAGALPMGARLRLKPGVDLSGFNPQMRKIFQAMKTYGLIVADNGSDMYISGTYDTNWDNGILNPAFGALNASDFEVITLGWKPPLYSVTVAPNPVVGGFPATGTVTLTAAAPAGGAVVVLSESGTGLTLPASVTVAAGKQTATFSIPTIAQTILRKPVITGTYLDSDQTLTVTVEPPPALHTFTVNPTSVASAATATGTVTLSENAPVGGVLVTLTSSNTAVATVPASVRVAAGAATASFTVTGKAVTVRAAVTISATYSGVTKTTAFTVD
jgi:hypothetical protein